MATVRSAGREAIADIYRAFARREAAGRSDAYQALAMAVADDGSLLAFLTGLPVEKRQPNLLFAAARYVMRRVPDIDDLRTLVATRHRALAQVMTQRRTQTNEPGRCATLLPALAAVSGPVALLEVGASAGLCLNLARYSYDFGSTRLAGADGEAPTLRCSIIGGDPPLHMPDVVWAAGIDLNPLDPADADDRSWLECLVWPGQPERAARLSAALDTAVRCPVTVHQGDLIEQFPRVLAQAPSHVTPVVFHSAVLAYVEPDARRAFAALVRDLGVTWVANEAPGVVVDAHAPTYDTAPFVLTVDGETVAYTHPHGDWIDWVA
jgi:hypothetical protein